MRKTNYLIYSFLPDKEKAILVHGYTGAFDLVDKDVLEYLLEFEKGQERKGLIDGATIEILKNRGYLTEKTPEEEEEHVYKLGLLLHKHHLRAKNWKHNILIIPTYRCQLRCPYCYEAPLYNKGNEWRNKTIDRKTVDAAFEAIPKLQPEREKCETLVLYGGEPLLKENVEIVNYIVEQGCGKGYQFDCITNGVDLNYFINLLGPNKIRFLQITLDGPPQIHDKTRRYSNGKGTFHKIASNIQKALNTGAKISIRTNVTRVDNMEGLSELTEIYKKYRWLGNPNFRAYCRVTYENPCRFHSNRVSSLDLVEWWEKRQDPILQLVKPDFGIGRKILGLLEEGKYPLFNTTFCGTTMGMYIMDPYGDIYLCWEAVGTREGKVGRFTPEISIDQEALNRWHNRIVVNIPECRKCECVFLCGGGCPNHAYNTHGDIMKPGCEEFKELFQRFLPRIYMEWEKRKG